MLRTNHADLQRMFHNVFFEGDGGAGGGGDGGGDGGGTGDGDKGGAGDKGGGGDDKKLSQADVDRIVQDRVGQTKRQTEEAIARQLGVSVEDAKKIIEDHQKQADKDKSEAQLAREAADREKDESEAEKNAAKTERHQAAVERALIRALPRDLEDDVLDGRVSRISRLVDVEVGADAAAIKAAVDALVKEMPELFGGESNGDPKGKAPGSDLKGKPPAKKQAEDAYARGLERAKGTGSTAGYPILESQKT